MKPPIDVPVARLDHAADLPLPSYRSAGAAGFDLAAAIPSGETSVIAPGASALIGTGFVYAIPEGYEGQVRPRSGLALDHGLTVLNAPGTIDWDYRGEVKVLLVNHGERAVRIERGMRIAQLVITPVVRAVLAEAALAEIDVTERDAGGFGSTGVAMAGEGEQ